MKTDSVLYWVIYFIVTVLVAWIAFSIILVWFKPNLFNANGSVNWLTTLWVAILIILFAWIIMIILWLLIALITQNGNGCGGGCPDPRIWRY